MARYSPGKGSSVNGLIEKLDASKAMESRWSGSREDVGPSLSKTVGRERATSPLLSISSTKPPTYKNIRSGSPAAHPQRCVFVRQDPVSCSRPRVVKGVKGES